MQEGLPSITAMYVAFARAVSTHEATLRRVCDDPMAERLLPSALGAIIRSAREGGAGQAIFRTLRSTSGGMFDHLALRTRLIDDAVRKAVSQGVKQLVVLGAGFDSRAHRMPELRETNVFEVDHPSTQRLKRKKAGKLPVTARSVQYAACDFHDVSIEAALASVGFEPSAPSIWIWEGVTMYLQPAAMLHSLDAMERLCASGSVLITSYVTPQLSMHLPFITGLSAGLMHLLSEPILNSLTPAAMAHAQAQRGFFVTSDVRPFATAARYGIETVKLAWGAPTEHICVSEKRTRSA